jgi:hypothetical protein
LACRDRLRCHCAASLSLDAVGPMARSVYDVAVTLGAGIDLGFRAMLIDLP